MDVFNQFFIDSVETRLKMLAVGEYITAEQLCVKVGIDIAFKPVIGMVLALYFPDYESVKSRGIRRKKLLTSEPVDAKV
jgi:hypothetical protein